MKKFLILFFAFSLPVYSCSKKNKEQNTDNSTSQTNKSVKKETTPAQNTDNKSAPVRNTEKTKPMPKLGIPVCDKYVKFVCSCHSRHPEDMLLKKACELGKNSLDDWQKKMKTSEEYETVVKACKKALLDVESDPKCKGITEKKPQ